MRETDLYAPVKAYLQKLGYAVHGEVLDCDMTATRGEDLVVVELKTGANMTLLVQATDRQRITDAVYVAIPAPRRHQRRQWRGVQVVLRMLELGLIVVHFGPRGPRAEVVFDPKPYQRKKHSRRRRALLAELDQRSGDYNVGGSSGTPLVTSDKTGRVLADNHYGWFTRVARGVYALTDQGRADLERHPELCALYRVELSDQAASRSAVCSASKRSDRTRSGRTLVGRALKSG